MKDKSPPRPNQRALEWFQGYDTKKIRYSSCAARYRATMEGLGRCVEKDSKKPVSREGLLERTHRTHSRERMPPLTTTVLHI